MIHKNHLSVATLKGNWLFLCSLITRKLPKSSLVESLFALKEFPAISQNVDIKKLKEKIFAQMKESQFVLPV